LQVIAPEFDEPLFSAEDLGGIIPKDSKKPFDIRKVPLLLSVESSAV
jgi:acetyl-CoA carboxylase carboxyltransferase component